jgi:hypothetical protein
LKFSVVENIFYNHLAIIIILCWVGRLNREHREEIMCREKVQDQEDQEGREKKENKRGDKK